MSTHVTTSNPVRTDILDTAHRPHGPAARRPRAWALSGLGAGLLGIGTIVTSSMVDVVYREEFLGKTVGVAAELSEKTGVLVAFHAATTAGALLLVVFAAGLYRRLGGGASGSAAPLVAFAGLLGTAVVSVIGAGLDTEMSALFAPSGEAAIPDSTASLYNNWIGTIPWFWVLAGVTGLALYASSRSGVVPRWIGRVGLAMGGLVVLIGISPMQYLAGPVAVLWLVATATGFLVGDRAYRSGAS